MKKNNYMFSGEKGQGLVEIALIMPLFILVLVGFIEWTLFFYTKMTVDSASFFACRNAVTLRDYDDGAEKTTNEATVKNVFMDYISNIPFGIISIDSSDINIDYETLINNNMSTLEYITIQLDDINYNTASGIGLYGIPDKISVSTQLRYEH